MKLGVLVVLVVVLLERIVEGNEDHFKAALTKICPCFLSVFFYNAYALMLKVKAMALNK